jgi:CMP-N,N'-diacetyllegionaminic acid synthase
MADMLDKEGSTIVTVCARGGSKALPRKNILPFCGRPLIEWTINQARSCPGVQGVYVSTDDSEIAQIALRAGADVPYVRPAHLASDTAAKIPAIEHLVSHLESSGMHISRIVDLQPTSPLRTVGDVAAAIALDPEGELTVSVCEPSHNPYYSLVEQREDGTLSPPRNGGLVARQEAPLVYGLNGAIYVWNRQALARAAIKGFWSVTMRPYVMPKWRSIDIDTVEDFEIAECVQLNLGRGKGT